MKKLIIIFILAGCFNQAFAQLNSKNREDGLFSIEIGPNQMFYNNGDFNRWTTANYNIIEKNLTGFLATLSYTDKHLGGGFSIGYNSPLTNYMAYFGYKLTGRYTAISSWLNLQFGELSARFKNIAPVNYQLTDDEIGQKMELHYNAAYIGISSKNYINSLHWNIKVGKEKIPVNAGFYASLGFTPFARNWRCGYYSYKDNDTTFVNRKVGTIPKTSKVYGSAGFFVAF